MSRYMSRRFDQLAEYVPGEQPRDRVYIKLNTNESPFPPAPGVLRRINTQAVEQLNLYPDPDCTELTRAVARRYGVEPENVFLSNGSDDILNFIFMGFCDEEKPVVFPDVTYGFYKVYADLYGLDYEQIPLQADLSVDTKKYCGIGKNIVLANPNAQTGIGIPLEEIGQIIRTNPDNLIAVDEAYVDFGWDSAVELTKKYDNVLVVQTFSKSRSLAGARLGFAIGAKELIGDLNKIKYSTNPYSINRLTQLAGLGALEDEEYTRKNCRTVMEVREYTKEQLQSREFLVTDSSANFVLAGSDRIGGGELYHRLKEKGILVRHFTDERIADRVRITIGSREEMDSLLKAVDEIMEEIK